MAELLGRELYWQGYIGKGWARHSGVSCEDGGKASVFSNSCDKTYSTAAVLISCLMYDFLHTWFSAFIPLSFRLRNTDWQLSKTPGCGYWFLSDVQCGGWEPKLVPGWEHSIILHRSWLCRQRRRGISGEQQNARSVSPLWGHCLWWDTQEYQCSRICSEVTCWAIISQGQGNGSRKWKYCFDFIFGLNELLYPWLYEWAVVLVSPKQKRRRSSG